METFLIIISSVVGVFLILNIYARVKMKNIPQVDDHKDILTLSDKNFQQQTKGKIVLVDFWAAWCAPCRMMAPVLNDVADDLTGNQRVGKINIEQQKSLANQFKVRSIPTLILFSNGKEVKRFVGIKQKEFLIREIQDVSNESNSDS
jgi:thioredoxin 1